MSVEKKPLQQSDDPWMGGSKQSSRLTPGMKQRIKELCLKRDGKKCSICGMEEENPMLVFEIHHKNGHDIDHRASNLGLAHGTCNDRENNRLRHVDPNSVPDPDRNKEKNDAAALRVPLTPFGEFIGQEIAEKMHKKREEYEPVFRRMAFEYFLDYHKQKKVISQKDLRIMARAYAGCSQGASYAYIEVLFGTNGPFTEDMDMASGEWYTKFRNRKDYDLSVQELERKYPVDGLRKSPGVRV